MRAIVLPIVILMLTATFAGCVGGDPDGDDSSGIDMEILNQMIDDNLQDFINNTSVTVNQEIHYHNNTTSNYQFAASDMTNSSGYRGQELFSVDYEFTIIVNGSAVNGSDRDYLIYEIEVPDSMGIFCINHGYNGNIYPKAYRNASFFPDGPGNPNSDWINWSRPIDTSLFLDGVPWNCESSFNGGSGDKIMQLTIDRSLENYGFTYWDSNGENDWLTYQDGDVVDLRLTWTYMLVPVISDTDGGVQ
jgi:hypothetical protein